MLVVYKAIGVGIIPVKPSAVCAYPDVVVFIGCNGIDIVAAKAGRNSGIILVPAASGQVLIHHGESVAPGAYPK